VQNARSYERSKSQAEFESLLNSISQKIQRAESVEDTLQTAIRELGSALGASRVKAVIAGYQNNSNTN
jgi:GAF domain-containing protein